MFLHKKSIQPENLVVDLETYLLRSRVLDPDLNRKIKNIFNPTTQELEADGWIPDSEASLVYTVLGQSKQLVRYYQNKKGVL